MISYSTQLHFDVDHGMDAAWDVLSRWAYRRSCRSVGTAKVPMGPEEWSDKLAQPEGRLQPAPATVLRWGIMEDRRALEFAYPDETIPNRLWRLNVGLGYSGRLGVRASLVWRLENASTAGLVVAQPGLVRDLISSVGLSSREPTRRPEPVAISRLHDMVSLVRDPQRRHAMILMSSRDDGGFPVAPEECQTVLAGLARVYVIPDGKTAWECSGILGNNWSSYKGSVRLLMPRRDNCQEEDGVPTRLLLPWEINEMVRRGDSPIERFLAMVGAEINSRIDHETFTPEAVQTEHHRQMIARLKAELAGGPDQKRIAAAERSLEDWKKREAQLQELIGLFEEDNRQLQAAVKTGGAREDALEQRLADAEVKRAALDQECARLRGLLRNRGQNEPEPAPVPAITVKALTDIPALVTEHYPNRVLISKRAVKSLEESPYTQAQDVWDAIELLGTTYWEAFQNGLGSTTEIGTKDLRYAAKTINWEYAPHLSAGTGVLYEGYNIRYKDRQADMSRHLKRGKSRDPKFSFRIYFEYDADDKVIVLHYAGRHLDNSRS